MKWTDGTAIEQLLQRVVRTLALQQYHIIYANDQATFENAIKSVDSEAVVYWLDD